MMHPCSSNSNNAATKAKATCQTVHTYQAVCLYANGSFDSLIDAAREVEGSASHTMCMTTHSAPLRLYTSTRCNQHWTSPSAKVYRAAHANDLAFSFVRTTSCRSRKSHTAPAQRSRPLSRSKPVTSAGNRTESQFTRPNAMAAASATLAQLLGAVPVSTLLTVGRKVIQVDANQTIDDAFKEILQNRILSAPVSSLSAFVKLMLCQHAPGSVTVRLVSVCLLCVV